MKSANRSNSIIGLLEWFRPGEEERVEQVLADLADLGVEHLRTGVSWADWSTPEGEAWYDWLIPRLADQVEVLPCFCYTPPSIAIEPRCTAPPRNPKAYADFLDLFITRHGTAFEYVELWNEPNSLSEWDWTLDVDWIVFCRMIGGAAYWARQRGKKTVLGGMSPVDPNWLRMICQRGVMDHIDVVGLHGFPGTWEPNWKGWSAVLTEVRQTLSEHDQHPEIWITETGYSTWRHDEPEQVQAFSEALACDVPRIYWYSAQDLDPSIPAIDGFHIDEREYHFGLRTADGRPKLLHRLWSEGGVERIEEVLRTRQSRRTGARRSRPSLITGGAGFVGTNLADRLLREGRQVRILDSLARPGVERNLEWLVDQHGSRLEVVLGDVRDPLTVDAAVDGAVAVYHLAAQVAVTSSLAQPRHDFEVNLNGTFNLLEAIRRQPAPPVTVFTSTNKVYGCLGDLELWETETRYTPADEALREQGVDESQPLDFHSPYGCSKGAADQYLLDYARSFDVPATVFRMSCIYGPHQFGTEDQGWVAHFLIRSLQGQPITIFGDGKQVRDILFVDDLVDAFLRVEARSEAVAGKAFNVGGGPGRTVSLLELIQRLGELHGRRPELRFESWRTGDQLYYVSNTGAIQDATGWRPQISVDQGLVRLDRWLRDEATEVSAVPEERADGRSVHA